MESINTLRPRQNGCHFHDDIFKCIFMNENVWISIKISLKFVPKGPHYNIPLLVQIMAWCRPGDKPLSEAVMANLPTHICVTRPQWVTGFCLLIDFFKWNKWALMINVKLQGHTPLITGTIIQWSIIFIRLPFHYKQQLDLLKMLPGDQHWDYHIGALSNDSSHCYWHTRIPW